MEGFGEDDADFNNDFSELPAASRSQRIAFDEEENISDSAGEENIGDDTQNANYYESDENNEKEDLKFAELLFFYRCFINLLPI